MLKFDYEVKDPSTGKHIRSTVQADSERAAGRLLIDQGFVPISITEQGKEGGIQAFLNRVRTKDRVVFTRQLATLIGAGIPLAQSLQTVADQTENKRLKSIAGDIVTNVEAGATLSDSFAKHPEVFDQVYIALIAAGEASGTLDKALMRVADQQEKDAAAMSKIRGALVYPVIVLFVIGAVLAFMLFTVVPQVKKLYKDMHQTLPFISQVMVSAADFAINYWWVLILAAVAAVILGQRYLKTESGQKFLDNFKLHVPLFGVMFQKLYMARFTRTGQTLMSSGVSLLDMLNISARAVNNSVIGGAISRSAEKVKGGKSLADSLHNEAIILPLVSQMIKVGEQSGRIDEMMGKTAGVYENELDDTIKSISTAIEPILMVVLAIVAGVMVAAILLPIYGLVNNVQV